MAYYIARSPHEGATRYYVYAAPEVDLSNGAEPIHDSDHLAILGLLRSTSEIFCFRQQLLVSHTKWMRFSSDQKWRNVDPDHWPE